MQEYEAFGLRDDWLNGWLAALGVTVLVDGATLRWSPDRRAYAVFEYSGGLAQAVASALPTREMLATLAIANTHGQFPTTPSSDQFLQAVLASRANASDFSLASATTDMVKSETHDGHSHFYAAAPGTVGTLWDRVARVAERLDPVLEHRVWQVEASLRGVGARVASSGLAIDVRRLEAGDPPSGGKYVDPVIEVLAFYGLALFPVRGNGIAERTRGWARLDGDHPSRPGRRPPETFTWASWPQLLDHWGIDALLATVYSRRGRHDTLDLVNEYAAVAYRTVASDKTRAIASRRVTAS